MKPAKKTLDDIGFIGLQPKKHPTSANEKEVALKTRKAMDAYRNRYLNKKKVV